MRQSRQKEAFSRLCIVGWYRASDTNKLSGRLRIGCVASSGKFSTTESVTKNGARRLPKI